MLLIIALHQIEHGFHHVLGLRARDEHRRGNQQVKAPEFLMSGDVLRGAAAGAIADDLIIFFLLGSGKLALRMSEEIGPVATQNKHQQQLRVQAWRRHIVFHEELVSGIHGLLELHTAGEFSTFTIQDAEER